MIDEISNKWHRNSKKKKSFQLKKMFKDSGIHKLPFIVTLLQVIE